MKQIGTIVVLLLLALGLFFLLSNQEEATAPTEEETATTTEETTATSTEDEAEDTGTSTETEEVDENTAYCTELKNNIAGSANWHIITTVVDGATIASGDELSGCVYSVNDSYGNWAPFEGQIGYYEVLASDGTSLAQEPLPTVGSDWMDLAMANEAIEYQATLDFDASGYSEGTLMLHNENAAGIPAMDQTVEIDVTF